MVSDSMTDLCKPAHESNMKNLSKVLTAVAFTVIFLLVACNNTTPTPVSPSPGPTPDDSLLPTKATNIPSKSGTIIGIPRGTQGQIGNVRIGLSTTGGADYVDVNGVQQHGMTATIQLFAKEGPSEWKTVYLGQSFQFNEYTFFVMEIRPTHLNPGDPPGTIGGGLISLLAMPK